MVNEPIIISLDDISPEQGVSLVGGRAATLASLASAGFPIPDGFVVTAEAWRRCIESGETWREIPHLMDGIADIDEETFCKRALGIREIIDSYSLPEPLIDAIGEAYVNLGAGDRYANVALRSSVASPEKSGTLPSGLFDSFPAVQGAEEVIAALKRVWAGAFTDRALRHLIRVGLMHRPWRMAAIVQLAVPADVTGILLSYDTQTGNLNNTVIRAVKAGSEKLPAGQKQSEVFVVNRADWQLEERRLAGQNPSGLSEELACSLARFGSRIEEHFGHAVEVDWCAVEGKFFVLDAKLPADQLARRTEITWSRAGLAEMMPGSMTPFTKSLIIPLLEETAHKAMRSVGIKVSDNAIFYADIYGRLYENSALLRDHLSGWAPTYPDIVPQAYPPGCDEESENAPGLIGSSILVARSQFRLRLLDAKVTKIPAELKLLPDRIARDDLRGKSDAALHILFDEIYASIKPAVQVWLESALVSILSHSTLRNILDCCGVDNSRGVHAELLAGFGDTGVAADAWKLARLAASIGDIPDKLKEATSWNEIESYLSRIEGGELFSKRLNKFIGKYGHHCLAPFELSLPRWREEPAEISNLLSTLVDAGESPDPDSRKETAAAKAREVARGLKNSMGFFGTLLLDISLRQANRADNLGAIIKEHLTNTLETMRTLALEIAGRFRDRGEISEKNDIFFLTMDEVKKVLALEALPGKISDLVEERTEEFNNLMERKHVPVTTSGKKSRPLEQDRYTAEILIEAYDLSGGIYTGPARLIPDVGAIQSLRRGEVLVVPEVIETFAPLITTSGAVVTEAGGFISSAAMLSRRFGVPCVGGAEDICNLIKNGDIITVDAIKGKIVVKSSSEYHEAGEMDNSENT